MKIFSLNSGPDQFRITDEDRLWVEENFRWLKTVFGYPNKLEEQVLMTPKFFPRTFSSAEISIDHVVEDLCKLFGIPRENVTYQVLHDLRDDNNIPYQVEGHVFECETELQKGRYRLYVANSLIRHPQRLVYCIIYEFIRIRLTESELEYDVGGDDTNLFLYLAGIYYGFGVILAQNLLYEGRASEGMWDIKWNYGAEMPLQVMAFSLATYANLRGESDPPWKSEFKSDFKKMFEDALLYLAKNPNDLYDAKEVQANDLFNAANDLFEKNQLDEAIAVLQKILFITNDDVMKADVFNNMGYYYAMTKNYQLAISNFRKAISLGSEYGFAHDNLGYALIMTGELEEGRRAVEKAMATGNNDPAYSFRNLAIYYHRKKEYDLADAYFQKAIAERTPVDLLDWHYAELLNERGFREKATEYYQKASEKNSAL